MNRYIRTSNLLKIIKSLKKKSFLSLLNKFNRLLLIFQQINEVIYMLKITKRLKKGVRLACG